MTKDDNILLPLKEAYRFGRDLGLGAHVGRIQRLAIEGPRPQSFDARIRRAYVAILFAQGDVFEKFKQRYWRNGDSPDGRRHLDEALRLKEEYERFLLFGQ
jgi:hypothetical protein